MNPENRNCQNCKNQFIIEPDDFTFYEKIGVPAPSFCPECRKQRRLSWRNDYNLHNNTCKSCNKKVISVFSPESGMNTFCIKCWWSDEWSAYDYSQDYDFSRPFFEQYVEFIKKVPVLCVVNDNGIGSVDCEYTHDFSFAKNCYMTFVSWKGENLMYVYYDIGGKYIVDSMDMLNGGEFLYENIFTEQCYKCKYSQNSIECSECNFIYDCKNCIECFMCTGLRNKRFYFKNKKYSKEEYYKILESYSLNTRNGVKKARIEFEEIKKKQIRRCFNIINSYNCKGDLLFNGKNSQFCFNVQRPEDSKWIENSDTPKDCYDLSTGGELNFCYEGITPDHSYKNLFGIFSWKNQEVEFAHHCHSSKYLFACAGLRNSEYSIFNKRYSKEEYFEMIEKIKKHMDDMPYVDKNGMVYKYGEFLPAELSYFGYNETTANLHFPLNKNQALEKNFSWSDLNKKTVGQETLEQKDIPDDINNVDEKICNEILKCVSCDRNYKIIYNEFEFYKRLNIPIPEKCFYCRQEDRFKLKNPYILWGRECMCNKSIHGHEGICTNQFETSYSPDRPEIVYCEKCYQQEIV